MNIYKYELKAGLRSSVLRAIILGVVLLFVMMMYPAFKDQIDSFRSMINSYPDGIIEGLGIDFNTISTILGFYAFSGLYLGLVSGKQSSTLGYNTLSKEIRERAADFLFTKPCSRSKIIISKLLATLTLLVITNFIYDIIATIVLLLFSNGKVDLGILFWLNITLFLLQFMILTVCIFLGVVYPKVKSVEGITLGVIGGFYVLKMLGSIIDEENIKYITPYGYFDLNDALSNNGINYKMSIVGIVISIIFLAISYIILIKKDINSV